MLTAQTQPKFIHLLYAPTNYCNMGCQYCYLGTGTDVLHDKSQLLSTLEFAVQKFLAAGIKPFNLSFHGGEATAIPRSFLEQLLAYAESYYQEFGAEIKAAGFPRNPIHIKTNLYNFDQLMPLFSAYQVSISGSVDLPLSLHAKYRTDKQGRSTLPRIEKNLHLLAQYPHHKKISCVVTRAHYQATAELIQDIHKIHTEIGLDMSRFNIMFSFDSRKNSEKFSSQIPGTEMLSQTEQVDFYHQVSRAFKGTPLEAGLKQHWFKEFTPEFCCSAVNCGDKFFMLQSNGDVYACPRGQSSRAFFYGNIFQDSVETIINRGWMTIEAHENQLEASEDCFRCEYLPYCNQGCVFVRHQTGLTKSYTCQLQQAIYRDQPERYPPYTPEFISDYAARYRFRNNFKSFKENHLHMTKERYITPELYHDDNALAQLIAKDPILQTLYASDAFCLTVDGLAHRLISPILANQTEIALLTPDSQVTLSITPAIFNANCKEPVNNFLHLMVLRNTLVTYGDEEREKQEHLVDYCLYTETLKALAWEEEGVWVVDLTSFFLQHQQLFIPDIRNNLYITTKTLREYHYAKQKKNAFYHIQAINLPFPFLEFYWQSA